MGNMTFRTLIISLLLISFTAACGTQKAENSESTETSENVEMAPDFEVTTVSGNTIRLQNSLNEGKPVVIYFTASWCPICAQNWPVLTEVYPEYEDQLTLVAIGIDPTDDNETMSKLAEEKGFTFPVTRGIPEIMLEYGVESQATTVGINKDGEIAFRRNKMALSADEYRELFDQLLDS